MKRYTEQMMFKCTKEEKEQIKKLAANSGMPVSEYIRSMALGVRKSFRKPNNPSK
jgi:hypothetical protein